MSRDMLSLRGYQRQAIDAVWQAHDGGMKRPAIVLPTGSGKTIVFSHATAEYLEAHPGKRVLILVHRDELADQALDKLRSVAPHLELGKVKAEDDATGAQVMVGSVQTLAREGRRNRLVEHQARYGPVGFVITDECHHALAESYGRVYAALPGAVHLGVTATMSRGDGQGLGTVWEGVVYQRSILRMIADGFLVDAKSKTITTELDLASVKKSGGDYQAAALGAAMIAGEVPKTVARAMAEHAADRKSIVFTPTVATAYATVEALEAVGIRAAAVDGTTPKEERAYRYRQFADGTIRALVNCMVLTEGFDSPTADCVVVARPTTSSGLFTQMAGRGLRPSPLTGKKDCLILTVAGGSGRIAGVVDLTEGEVQPKGGVREDETLTEAALRAEEELEDTERARREKEGSLHALFRLKAKEVDLFAGSTQNWLRTRAGVMFVPAGENGQVALWPSRQVSDDGQQLWDVVHVPRRQGDQWVRLHEGHRMGTAQAWAETEADDFASFGVRKAASWRQKKPTDAQLGLARTMGLRDTEGLRAGEVGDYISVVFASRAIDRYVPQDQTAGVGAHR